MKVLELKQLLADVPDDADIDFSDGNFGGLGERLDAGDINVDDKQQLLIRPPYWSPVD